MVNYGNAKIYTMRSYIRPDLIYVGSTVQPLKERMRLHRSSYKRYVEGKFPYVTSFKIIELGDSYIELYEKVPCSDKEELHKHEGEVIRELDCVNKHIPGRTGKQYREDNKEEIKEWRKKHYGENRDAILEQNKKWYEENKEKRLEYQKEWREANKEALLEKAKQYYEENKQEVLEKAKKYYDENKEKKKQKYTCECGSVINICCKARHMKSKKHQKFINSNITDINVV